MLKCVCHYYMKDFNIIKIVKLKFMKKKSKKRILMAVLCLFTTLLPGVSTVKTFAQSVQEKVSGSVVDESGEPIIGATVVVEGTTSGTITDFDGNFQISVDSDASLSISFIGFTTQVIPVNGRSNISVTLLENTEELDEVVAIGYGVQKKSSVTGAISQVKSTDIENRTSTNVSQALQGKTSGVQVIQTSGKPGASGSIRVRGFSSNAESNPLYIVDGLQVSDIGYLDPNNIESMEVLKDAASAAIYGAQAGNGVVLITTKSGKKSGQGKIFYDYQRSVQSVANAPDVMNSVEYKQFMTEAGYISQNEFDTYWNGTTDTKWTDVAFEDGIIDRHTLGFQGGNEKGSFFVSISNLDNNGIIGGDKDIYKRLTSQVNADYQVKDWLKIGITNSIERYESKEVSENNEYGSLLLSTLVLDPLTPAYFEENELPDYMAQNIGLGRNYLKDEQGRYYSVSAFNTNQDIHPFITRDNRESGSDGLNILGTVYGDFTPIKGLVVTSKLGYRIGASNRSSYSFPYFAYEQVKSDQYSLSATATNSLYYQWENYANYNFSVNKHDFGAMAGMSYINSISKFVTGSGDELVNYEPNFRYLDYITSSANDDVSGITNESSQLAYFGRLSWSYDSKYMLQANFRADAFDSSKLSKDKRWGYFPSLSAGWVASNENFMKNILDTDVLSYLKLRASWGQNGNVSVLRGYPYKTSISVGNWKYQYNLDGSWYLGSAASGLANPDLQWETSEQIDLGLDARLFNDRLTLAVDYFNKKTKGLLVNVAPPLETGSQSVTTNAGNVQNHGFEFELGWRDNIDDFSYGVNANIATLRNKVTYLDPSIPRLPGASMHTGVVTMCEVDEPIWFMYGYKYAGVDEVTGDPLFVDLTNDGAITEDDKTNIGSAIPDFTYGITVNMAYKGFDLVVFGSGSYGNDVWMLLTRTDYPKKNRMSVYYDERWTPSNTNAARPRPGANDEDKYWLSDGNIFDGSYFKIKQIQLGYTVPKKLTKKVAVDNLRLYVSLDDYFTFTKYPGFDPEVSASTTSGIGLDKGSYPTSKKVVFGLNLTF